jgi:hypothetical protein
MHIVSRAKFLGMPATASSHARPGPRAAKTKHFTAAVALALFASLWAIGLATPADAALHPNMTVTPAETRRKPRDIAPPYIVEWVMPDWYRSKLRLTAARYEAHDAKTERPAVATTAHKIFVTETS